MIKRIKAHKFLTTLIVASAMGVGVVTYFLTRPTNDTSFVEVKRGSIVEAVYGIGTVHATKIYELKVGIPTTIEALYVKEGDVVSKGSRLLSLRGLREFGAPFEGVVTSLPYRIGEAVFPQVSVLTLTNFKDRYLLVSLEQEGAIRAKRGMNVRVSFESLRKQTFEGSIESVYSNADRFLVRIEVPKLPSTILPGMTADVSITISRRENIIVVPVNAIELGKVKVRRGKSGKMEELSIETGIIDHNSAEVVSGNLREGDFVLVHKE